MSLRDVIERMSFRDVIERIFEKRPTPLAMPAIKKALIERLDRAEAARPKDPMLCVGPWWDWYKEYIGEKEEEESSE